MSVILDLGTGAPDALTTSPQAGVLFYLSPQPGATTHLSVVLTFAGGLLPPDIRVAVQALADDGESYAVIATIRQGHTESTAVQTLPYHSFAAVEGARAEFLLLPPVRVARVWRVVAWTTSAAPSGHRITIYSDTASVVGLHVSPESLGLA